MDLTVSYSDMNKALLVFDSLCGFVLDNGFQADAVMPLLLLDCIRSLEVSEALFASSAPMWDFRILAEKNDFRVVLIPHSPKA